MITHTRVQGYDLIRISQEKAGVGYEYELYFTEPLARWGDNGNSPAIYIRMYMDSVREGEGEVRNGVSG